jgi:hypothetical protein
MSFDMLEDMKKVTYSVVLTPSIREALEVAAQKDRRSMSSLLEKIIIDYLDKQGIPWENDITKSTPSKRGRPKKTYPEK